MLWRLLQHITAASNMNVGYTTSELCRFAFVDLIWSPAGGLYWQSCDVLGPKSRLRPSQLTQYGKSKLVYCWSSVVDGVPLLKQHWLNVWAGISTELFSCPEILSHFHTLNIPSERMNITEISLRGYEYYRNLPQRVWILPKSPSEGTNITEISLHSVWVLPKYSLRVYEYYQNIPSQCMDYRNIPSNCMNIAEIFLHSVCILPKYHLRVYACYRNIPSQCMNITEKSTSRCMNITEISPHSVWILPRYPFTLYEYYRNILSQCMNITEISPHIVWILSKYPLTVYEYYRNITWKYVNMTSVWIVPNFVKYPSVNYIKLHPPAF